jgi:flavin reductase (DIM6/NTAB) family NADH-FMN oxidoreductase RutF
MDEKAKKTALRTIPYGLFVVGVKKGEEYGGFTASWLSQCSFDPPLVMMAVRVGTAACDKIKADRVFVVNALGKDQQTIAQTFFKPPAVEGGQLGGHPFRLGVTGAPILEEAIAYFECNVVEIIERGDHHVIIGEVVDAGVHREEPALTLADTGWNYGG